MQNRDYPARGSAAGDPGDPGDVDGLADPADPGDPGDFGDVTVVATQAFRHNLADVLNRVAYRGDQVLVTRHGKPFVAIVSAGDLRGFRLLEADADPEPDAT
jgi:prevent-host-death family protein